MNEWPFFCELSTAPAVMQGCHLRVGDHFTYINSTCLVEGLEEIKRYDYEGVFSHTFRVFYSRADGATGATNFRPDQWVEIL